MRLFLAITMIVNTAASAWAECSLDQFVGYTLVARKTVAGYIQDGKRGDSFEGCEFGRIIVFDDNTGVACDTYSYSYSYRPTAYIWASKYSLKLCVGGSTYSVSHIR